MEFSTQTTASLHQIKTAALAVGEDADANRAGRCWRSMAGREEEVGVSMR